jgi:rhodanese-related sulfurtransferase
MKLIFSKNFLSYLRPIPVILLLSFLGVSTVGIAAVVNGMDVPTLINSLNTKQVTVAELQQRKLQQVILIDVRSPEEYAEDHIAESLLVPLTDIEASFGVKRILSIAQESAKSHQYQPTVVLYCTSGMRSVKAYQHLKKTGLNIVVLSGGIKAWRQSIAAQKDTETLAPMTKAVKQNSPL